LRAQCQSHFVCQIAHILFPSFQLQSLIDPVHH
jgi:hypothetical protein